LSTLADRIREVLSGTPGPHHHAVTPPVRALRHTEDGSGRQPEFRHEPDGVGDLPSAVLSVGGRMVGPGVESVLGGDWHRRGDAVCFVVESRRERTSRHGHTSVGMLADSLREAAGDVALLAGCPIREKLLFFDLETTGLSGGAGTYAFLAGCAWFDEDGAFATRQFMLVRMADERALLASIADEMSGAGALVSFNGKSFDRPLIETRYLYHRLAWTGATLPHLDMLHVARRFWRRDGAPAAATWQGPEESSCSLAALERQLLGHRRKEDVPGFEIPARYFQFIRNGDARPLAPVFEHNRLDLLSLAALTARAAHLARQGPGGARDPREALALGWLYARAGMDRRAREAYERAVDLSVGRPATHVESLRALAIALRRARQYDEAAGCWRRILEVRGCPGHVAREASDALAIHHEHRVRDLMSARKFALRSLEREFRPAGNAAARYRLDRIDRKLERLKSDAPTLQFAEP
jgi:uncharacterized protein YprB with RNaseH-like and TPR domain